MIGKNSTSFPFFVSFFFHFPFFLLSVTQRIENLCLRTREIRLTHYATFFLSFKSILETHYIPIRSKISITPDSHALLSYFLHLSFFWLNLEVETRSLQRTRWLRRNDDGFSKILITIRKSCRVLFSRCDS